MVGSLASLACLPLGAFAIGTEGFMIARLLPALAHDLDVGLPAAGNLVTAFSLAYALDAPVQAELAARVERKHLLAAPGRGALDARIRSTFFGEPSERSLRIHETTELPEVSANDPLKAQCRLTKTARSVEPSTTVVEAVAPNAIPH